MMSNEFSLKPLFGVFKKQSYVNITHLLTKI